MQDPSKEIPLRILIVDDDEVDREAARRALLKSGLLVETDDAYTVAGALSALERLPYDCALLDFTLPDGDGLLLLLEAQSRGISTPLIMLTGVTDEMIAVELMKAGAADYLPKAKVSPESLGRAVQSASRLHQAQLLAKKADAERRVSDAQFRRVAESNIIGIMFWETDGSITDANEVFLNLVGCTREDLDACSINWRDMTPPEYLALDDEKIAELRQSGSCAPWEKEFRSRDGSRVAALISASFLEPPDRKGLAFVVDITERKRAQDAQQFLAEASAALSASPYYEISLPNVARLAVPGLADWCVFDLLEDGQPQRIALANADPALEAKAREHDTRFAFNLNAPNGPAEVMRTAKSELFANISNDMMEANSGSGEQFDYLREMKLQSYLCVPLTARGRTIGAMTWLYAESGRRYTQADLMFAEQVGQRTALAIDNARLLFETQARAEREAVVNAIGHAIRASLDTEEIIQVAVREVGQALKSSRCLWCWINPMRETLTVAPQQYNAPGIAAWNGRYSLSGLPDDFLAQLSGTDPIVVDDFARHPQAPFYQEQMPDGKLAALVACPISLRGDRQGLFVVQQLSAPRHWTLDEVALLRQVSDLLMPALGNAQLYAREHRVADMLQAAFLSNVPDYLSELELSTVYHAGLDESQVGGDCYDVFPLPGGRVALVIADVSGKGLSAAVLTATVKYSLRAFAAEVAAPSLAITRLNRMLCSEATGMGEHFVTLFYAVFDPANGQLTYASAGHETQIIKREKGTTLLHALDPILGVSEHNYEQREEHLHHGDSLILFTDGLTEARNPDTRELLNVERVVELIEAMPALVGAGGLTARLEQRAMEWAHGRPHDDMALLAARRTRQSDSHAVQQDQAFSPDSTTSLPPAERLFQFTFPSRAVHASDVRQAVGHWMETLKFRRDAIEDFQTAVTEAVTNAVRHGSPQGELDEFHVSASYHAETGELHLEIRDHGAGLKGRNTAPPMPEPEAMRGRGLPLIAECTDNAEYVPTPDGLCVRLLKRHAI